MLTTFNKRLCFDILTWGRRAVLCTGLAASAPIAFADSAAVSPDTHSSIGYIPAPQAGGLGRAAIMQSLRARSREELENSAGCQEYVFSAKRLMDTRSVFVLETTSQGQCGPKAHSVKSWQTYEMNTGKEYDAARLYDVLAVLPNGNRVLRPDLRYDFVRKTFSMEMGGDAQESRNWVAAMLPNTEVVAVLTPRGLLVTRVGSDQERVGWDEVVFPYSRLKDHLNTAEARRLGWAVK